jgi:DNA-binding MarR family transcriptional regulator
MIGALLRMPAEAVRRRMLEQLRAHGFDGLQAAHLNVFQYPGPEGARPSELAAELGMSKQALNYMLGELERLGYLERLPDPEDTRSKRIALTARGSAAVKTMLDAVRAVEHDWRRELGAKEFEQLRALLLDLNDRL